MMQTIEQQRANFCLKKIQKDKKFKTNAQRLVSFIVSNGLLPTLAFYKKDEKKPVYELLNSWLKEKHYINNDALKELAEADANKLLIVTSEAIAFSNWLKKVVEIEIKD